MTRVPLCEITAGTSVRFGTSGVRGLAAELTDRVCYGYTVAFLQHLQDLREIDAGGRVAMGGDLRPSTPRMLGAVARAVADRGFVPIHCGTLPSPAVALFGLAQRIPTVMVTGSHIPADRNGIKFTRPKGEILKDDEQRIQVQHVCLPDHFDEEPPTLAVRPEAAQQYVARYLRAFPAGLLRGKRIGLYEHSAVGRDLIREILERLGAEVVRLGRSEVFVPVDTEAIRPEDVALASAWAQEHQLFSILSTDGDSDRPLVSDEHGRWLRGDVAGILTARFLRADVVVTAVSCNTALERCGWFSDVRRTRIGSPYVIAELQRAVAAGGKRVVGYEANGGFLTATQIDDLPALPTRDAVLVHLAILSLAVGRRATISSLVEDLPPRFTASDRLTNFPTDRATARIEALATGGTTAIESALSRFGKVAGVDQTDGLRITFTSGEIVHLRPSGNAPELRCYTEADTDARSREMLAQAIAILETWR
jgi:phosphomannomutase